MTFIKVTDQAGEFVYINIDHIVTIESEGNRARIDLDADHARDKYIVAQENPERIMSLIEEALRAPVTRIG